MFIISQRKKGRPKKFENIEAEHSIEKKKQQLFESKECSTEYLNLINLAYQTGKLNKKEFELGVFLEKQYSLNQQYMELKSIPKNSPNTWNFALKITKNIKPAEEGFKKWHEIQTLLKQYNPKISQEFFKLISSHHTYEELLILKLNQRIMQILKEGLKTLIYLIDLGYLS